MTQPVREQDASASMTRVLTRKFGATESSNVVSGTCRPAHRQSPDLLNEDIFNKIVSWERKRATRAGRSVLLMLLDVERVLLKNSSNKESSRITSAVSSPARETDVIGWYDKNAVLGVIFTDLNKADSGALQNLMTEEVTARLRANLGPEQADKIRISFHLFPEDSEKPNGNLLMDEKLYPDFREGNLELSRLAKRAIDIFVSAIALILFSPLFVLISAAVKLTSKGPILFRQQRVGQYGRRFTFLKFRSMKCGNDPLIHQDYVRRFIAGDFGKAQGVTYKIKADPRLTRIGGFLRKCSLDELPQLVNVLRGEMSLVGPRPAIPYEIDFYRAWHRSRYLEVKPGITGLWQVTGRSKTTFDDMVRLDLRYVRQWSLWLDLKILWYTPRAVLSGEGAY
jgi:exopolysaccharide biosynthesis polyprenyl glycosylphosphotransferase